MQRLHYVLACEHVMIERFVSEQCSFDFEKIVTYYKTVKGRVNFCGYLMLLAEEKQQQGALATAEHYRSTSRCFMRYRMGVDINLNDVTREVITNFEMYGRQRGLSPNSIVAYVRVLKAAYRRAVDEELVADCHPFKHITTTAANHVNVLLMNVQW